MSLTWALIALALLVLGVIAWQGYRPARKSIRRAGPRQADPPVGRSEPPLGDLDGPDTVPDVVAPSALRQVPRLDALIDALVALPLDQPITGDAVLLHLPASRRAGTKPYYVEGLRADCGEWEPPQPGQRYSELQAGVQMVNRGGALNEIEYSEFVQQIQAFADAVGATPEVPDMLDVVARARELDAFASPRDAQLSVTLKSEGAAWSVGYLQQVAQRHGFVAGNAAGRMVRPAAEAAAPPLLTLSYDAQAALADDPQKASVRECQLSLDVPQTPAAAEPFPAWHDAARQLADEMSASVVDDHGESITLHAFATIGRDLEQLYAQLAEHDLAAGSPAARRLFSG